jgi:hypothetical protein
MKNEKQSQKRKRGGQLGNRNARTHWITQLLGSESVSLLESHSFSPVPEKPERMPKMVFRAKSSMPEDENENGKGAKSPEANRAWRGNE